MFIDLGWANHPFPRTGHTKCLLDFLDFPVALRTLVPALSVTSLYQSVTFRMTLMNRACGPLARGRMALHPLWPLQRLEELTIVPIARRGLGEQGPSCPWHCVAHCLVEVEPQSPRPFSTNSASPTCFPWQENWSQLSNRSQYPRTRGQSRWWWERPSMPSLWIPRRMSS